MRVIVPPQARVLPRSPTSLFGEWHSGVLRADPEAARAELPRVRWSELQLARPFLLARGFGIAGQLDRAVVDTFSPISVVVDEPLAWTSVMVGRPWSPVPVSRKLPTLAAIRDFDEPNWLKYGMDWRFSPLPGGRTFVETSTLCQPTDAKAMRRFLAYWSMIRIPSGLIRRDIIAALGRRVAAAG